MSPRRRLSVLVLLLLLTVTAAWLVFGETIGRYDQDLDVFVRAGGRALAGEDLYRPADGDLPFKYAPATAFFFAPLAALPPDARSPAWFAFSMLALASALSVFWSGVLGRSLPRSLREAAPLLLGVLAGQGFVVRLARNGQTDGVVLLLCVAAAVAADRTHGARAAAGWIGATALKIAPAIVGLYVLRRQTLRVAGWSALAVLALAVLPALVWGPGWAVRQHVAWAAILGERTPSDLDYFGNHSASAVAHRLAGASVWPAAAGTQGERAAVATLVVAALAIVLALRVQRWATDDGDGRGVALAAVLLLVPLLSPLSWAATCVMALPAFIVLPATRGRAGRPWLEDALFALAVVLANVWVGRDFQALAPRFWGLLLALVALLSRARGLPLRGAV